MKRHTWTGLYQEVEWEQVGETPQEQLSVPAISSTLDPAPPDAAAWSPPSCEPIPADAYAAFSHFTESDCDPASQTCLPDPAGAARATVAGFDQLDPAAKTTALGNMTPAQVAQLANDLPPAERHKLVELARLSPNPEDKLVLFMAGQKATVEEDAAKDLDGQMDAETASAMEERRRQIAASTMDELRREETRLRALGSALSPDAVNEMIRRKTTEHDLEMKHNVNFTAEETERKTGPLANKRVEWSYDELRVMQAALAQAPTMQRGDNLDMHTFHRVNNVPDANAQHFKGKIEIGDGAVSDGHGNYDPSGKPKPDTDENGNITKRDPRADPRIEAEHGTDTTFMEWVVLHELGHNTHDYSSSDDFAKYKRGMMIHDLDPTEAEARVPSEMLDSLDHGLQQLEHNGFVYVKESVYRDGKWVHGYKAFPRAVFDNPDANPDAKEYFAQHYNQAILAPETTAVEYLDEPAAKESAARSALEAALLDQQRRRNNQEDTSDVDRRIEQLRTAAQHATAQRKVWQKSYDTMRNDVFGTGSVETEARQRLVDAGIDTGEFDLRVQRLSTPDQVALLEAEILREQTP